MLNARPRTGRRPITRIERSRWSRVPAWGGDVRAAVRRRQANLAHPSCSPLHMALDALLRATPEGEARAPGRHTARRGLSEVVAGHVAHTRRRAVGCPTSMGFSTSKNAAGGHSAGSEWHSQGESNPCLRRSLRGLCTGQPWWTGTKTGEACVRTQRTASSDLPGDGLVSRSVGSRSYGSTVRVVGLSREPPWACAVTDTSLRGPAERARDTRSLAALHDLDVAARDASSACLRPGTGPCHRLFVLPFRPSTVRALRVDTWRDGLQPKLGVAAFHDRVLPLGAAASTPTVPKDGFGALVPPSTSRSTLVVSHHFGGLLRISSAGLLHPAAGPGVRHVSRFMRRPGEPVGHHSRSPHRGSDPPKNATHRQPYRVTAAVAPLVFSLVQTTPRMPAMGEPTTTSRLPCLIERPDCGSRHRAWDATHACQHAALPPREAPAPAGSEASRPHRRVACGCRRRPGRAASRVYAEACTRHLLAEGHVDESTRVGLRWEREPHNARAETAPTSGPPKGAVPDLAASRSACWCEHRREPKLSCLRGGSPASRPATVDGDQPRSRAPKRPTW